VSGLTYILQHGSYLLLMAGLVAAGLGFPVTEDVYILAGGVLAQRGIVILWLVLPLLFAGVIIGDIMIFVIARRLGPAAYKRRIFAWLMPPERREKMDAIIERRGGLIVFGARFVAGLRMPVFAMAAVHGMPLARFLVWDIAAMILSIPLMFGLGWFFAGQIEAIAEGVATARHYILLGVVGVAALAIVGVLLARVVRKRSGW